MTYVYVLTSGENDHYLEQALLSIVSLRRHVPHAHIRVLTDSDTKKSLQGNRAAILKYIDETTVLEIDPQYSKRAKSRWLKTSMGLHISDDFLYIDCDTVIADDISKMNYPQAAVSAALDRNVFIHESPFITEYLKEVYPFHNLREIYASDKYFNSGVIYCRNLPQAREFFMLWHSLWKESYKKGTVLDQPAFNAANLQMGMCINELQGKWNCQITMDMRYLAEAQIIHYLTTNKYNIYTLADPDILQKIKQDSTIPPDVEEMLKDPKNAIRDTRRRMYTDEAVEFSETKVYAFYFTLYIKAKKLFAFFEAQCLLLRKLRNLLFRKNKNR